MPKLRVLFYDTTETGLRPLNVDVTSTTTVKEFVGEVYSKIRWGSWECYHIYVPRASANLTGDDITTTITKYNELMAEHNNDILSFCVYLSGHQDSTITAFVIPAIDLESLNIIVRHEPPGDQLPSPQTVFELASVQPTSLIQQELSLYDRLCGEGFSKTPWELWDPDLYPYHHDASSAVPYGFRASLPHDPTPIEAFHPLFAYFHARSKDANLPVTGGQFVSAYDFIQSATQITLAYEKEPPEVTQERLNDLLARTLDQLVYPMAGNMGLFYRHKSPAGLAPILAVEQCEYRGHPVKASSSSWLQFWNKHCALRDATFCPAFLLTINLDFGPKISVHGAILTTSPIILPLASCIRITPGLALQGYQAAPYDHEIMDVARILFALKEACALLSYYYRDFDAPIERTERFFPLATQFDRSLENGDETPISFDYIDLLKRSTRFSTVFLARERVSRKLVDVKFARQYSAQAHLTLAGLEYAPKLLYCGRVWHEHEPDSAYNVEYNTGMMVVTEHIEGVSAADIRPGEVEGDTAKAELVRAAVLDALEHLHKEKLVHGDIRLPNIVVVDGDGDVGTRVKILDFEWAGVLGVVRYPFPRGLIIMAPGADRGELIMEEHNLYLARHLYELE